jgi:hypothetical protein
MSSRTILQFVAIAFALAAFGCVFAPCFAGATRPPRTPLTGIPGPREPVAGVKTSVEMTLAGYARADKKWPPSGTFKGYRRVAKLNNLGRFNEGLQLQRVLTSKALVLAPEQVSYSDNREFGARRDHGWSVLNAIWATNRNQATRFASQGRADKALAVLAVNVRLCSAMVHSSPHTMQMLSLGKWHWRTTWDDIAGVLSNQKRYAEAKAAKEYGMAARRLGLSRVEPELAKQEAREEAMHDVIRQLPMNERRPYEMSTRTRLFKEQSSAAERLVKLWDKEVETPECLALLHKLLK